MVRDRQNTARHAERGSALLVVMLIMFLLSAVAFGASVVTRVEIAVAEKFRQAAEGLYVAEAGVAATLAELRPLPDWTQVVDGSRRSALSEGVFDGTKFVPGGGTVVICCGPESASDRLAREMSLSPLPARRLLHWEPFLWTTFEAIAPATPPSRFYLLVWVADDEEDADGNGLADSNGIVIVRAEALEPGGVRRIVEVHVSRSTPPGVEPSEEEGTGAAEPLPPATAVGVLRWREVR